ncbi:MAG TPA: metallophosphoesterase, partial [Kofleriaceae bacterium]
MRTLVMGDPQASFATMTEILRNHELLGGDGRLADDVVLVSIGDHFDYDLDDPVGAGREGVAFLRWLASHDPAQVVLLIGNHDVSRVMELAAISDARFAEARRFARSLDGDPARDARFLAAFPDLPTRGLAARDYAAFSVAQRELVQGLLLGGRFRLAATGALADGREVLLSHAGVVDRELAMLGVDATPAAIAGALAQRLAAAIERVRDDWERGVPTALSLEPLHVAGAG